jgi:formiminotetrahydrofolate cyclodeaminase
MNVRINLESLEDQTQVKKFASEIRALEKEATGITTSVQTVMEERGGLPFN